MNITPEDFERIKADLREDEARSLERQRLKNRRWVFAAGLTLLAALPVIVGLSDGRGDGVAAVSFMMCFLGGAACLFVVFENGGPFEV